MSKSQHPYHYDVIRLQRVILQNGYAIDYDSAAKIWDDYSDEYFAGWLTMPNDDKELWQILKDMIKLNTNPVNPSLRYKCLRTGGIYKIIWQEDASVSIPIIGSGALICLVLENVSISSGIPGREPDVRLLIPNAVLHDASEFEMFILTTAKGAATEHPEQGPETTGHFDATV